MTQHQDVLAREDEDEDDEHQRWTEMLSAEAREDEGLTETLERLIDEAGEVVRLRLERSAIETLPARWRGLADRCRSR